MTDPDNFEEDDLFADLYVYLIAASQLRFPTTNTLPRCAQNYFLQAQRDCAMRIPSNMLVDTLKTMRHPKLNYPT